MKASALRTVDLAQRCLVRLFLRMLKPKSEPKEAAATAQQSMLEVLRADNVNCDWNIAAGEECIPCEDTRGSSTGPNATDKQTEGARSPTSSSLQTHLMTEFDTRQLQDISDAGDGEYTDHENRGRDGVSKKSRLAQWITEFKEQCTMKLEDRNANGKAVVELAPRKLALETWLEDFEAKHRSL